jgi:hypothetical protein
VTHLPTGGRQAKRITCLWLKHNGHDPLVKGRHAADRDARGHCGSALAANARIRGRAGDQAVARSPAEF